MSYVEDYDNELTFLCANPDATRAAWEYRDGILDAILELDKSLESLGVPSGERAMIRQELRLSLLSV